MSCKLWNFQLNKVKKLFINIQSKVEGLHYLGLGIGGDYPITDRLSIDVGMMFYNIINDLDTEKGDYNIYTLGLNVDLMNQ